MARKRVLFLGAAGMIGPHLTPGLEEDYDLVLADVKPHPGGAPVRAVDVTDYGQVLDAARGVDAVMNFTVVRGDPVQSFRVNLLGAWHVMRAAAELGIGKVIHSGPEAVMGAYGHDFGVGNAPDAPGSGYYGVTKLLSRTLCREWARERRIPTLCLLFCFLQPRPERTCGQDFHRFAVVYDDLHRACKLALELDPVPDWYQEINLLSFEGQGKFVAHRARRILGFAPAEPWEDYYRRPVPGGDPAA